MLARGVRHLASLSRQTLCKPPSHIPKTPFSPIFPVRYAESDATLDSSSSLRVGDVLRNNTTLSETVALSTDVPLRDAITHLARRHLGGALVVEGQESTVLGMLTLRDIVRTLASIEDPAEALSIPVDAAMTPASRMIHVDVDEDIQKCLLIMSELKIRSLPVLYNDRVVGLVSLKDLVDAAQAHLLGGKKVAVESMVGRRGLRPSTTFAGHLLRRSAAYEAEFGTFVSLGLHFGAVSLPRPQRYEKPNEDAFLAEAYDWPGADGSPSPISVLAVADGVGSWHERGVDPTKFPHSLVTCMREYLSTMHSDALEVAKSTEYYQDPHGTSEVQMLPAAPSPLRLLRECWSATVQRDRVIGSSTICILSLDARHGQLVAANVGDSGFVIVRPSSDPDGRIGSLSAPTSPIGVVTSSASSKRKRQRDGGLYTVAGGDAQYQ